MRWSHIGSKSSTSRPRSYDDRRPFFISRLKTSKRSFWAARTSSGARLMVISKSLILSMAPVRRALLQERLDSLGDIFGLKKLVQINLLGAFERRGEVFQRRFPQPLQRDSQRSAALAAEVAEQRFDRVVQLVRSGGARDESYR